MLYSKYFVYLNKEITIYTMDTNAAKRLNNIYTFIGEYIQNFIRIEQEVENLIISFFCIPSYESTFDKKEGKDTITKINIAKHHNREIDSFYRHVVFNERFDFISKLEYLKKIFNIRNHGYFDSWDNKYKIDLFFDLILYACEYRNLLAHNKIQYMPNLDGYYILKNSKLSFTSKIEFFKENGITKTTYIQNLNISDFEIRENEMKLMNEQLIYAHKFLTILALNPRMNYTLKNYEKIEPENDFVSKFKIVLSSDINEMKGLFTFRLTEKEIKDKIHKKEQEQKRKERKSEEQQKTQPKKTGSK